MENAVEEQQQPIKKKKSVVREYAEALGTAILIAFFLRAFVIEAFKIPSGSMIPNLLIGDHLFVNKFTYGIRFPFSHKWIYRFRNPERGESIIFIFPEDPSKDFIKRVNKQWFLDLPSIPPAVWQKDLDTIIAENIDLLEAETKTVIKQASVAPTNVGIDILKDVAHQNEGETLDALDKARRLNIIRPTEPNKQDQFTFTTKHFQEIVYQNIEEKERETLHQAVGDATEKLYQDKLDSVAPTLAFHFAKAGDEAKAQMYGQKAENITSNLFRKDEIPEYYSSVQGIVQSKIKEAIQPLSPQKMALVKDLLRNLLSTSKNMRLYPDGSQLIVMASGACCVRRFHNSPE